MVPHIRAPDHDGALPGRHRQEGLLPERRLEGISRVARARRSAEEGRHGPPSARHATRARSCGSPTRTPSRRTCGLRARRTSTTPTSASSTSIRRGRPDALRAAALALRDLLASSACPAGSRPPARRASTSSCRSTARPTSRGPRFAHAVGTIAGQPRSGSPDAGVQQGGSRRADLVDTGRNGYSATFAAP